MNGAICPCPEVYIPMPKRNSVPTLFCLFASSLFLVAADAQAPNATSTSPPPTPVQTSAAPRAPLNPALPTVFIVGDSTARNQADLGWGDHAAHVVSK